MIERIVEMELPAGEKLIIEKNRIQGERLRPDAARLAIVTGSHGDELEGCLLYTSKGGRPCLFMFRIALRRCSETRKKMKI